MRQALFAIIIGALLLFPGSFSTFRYLANDYASNARAYSSYYNSYYSNNYGNTYNNRPVYISGAGNYVAGYGNGNYGYSPYLMTSTSYNSLYGYRQNYVSHIYVRNALDYTYYTHPELLATRYMDNHQRWVRGSLPQWFSY